MAEAALFALFSRDLRALMQAPRPGLAREPIGLILNAFFGWGVLPGQAVELDRVMPGSARLLRADHAALSLHSRSVPPI